MKPIERAQRSLGGLCFGDAFGQFLLETLPRSRRHMISRELIPLSLLCDGKARKWTDDTEMAVSIVECLKPEGINQDELAKRFAKRFHWERGYGSAAQNLIYQIRLGKSWKDISGKLFDGQGSCGNGSAMRVAPLGAYFAEDEAKVVENAKRSAMVTHAHPEGIAGAVAVALAAAQAALGADKIDFGSILRNLEPGEVRDGIEKAAAIPFSESPEKVAALLGSGKKVLCQDTVPFSLWCADRHWDDFDAAMWTTAVGEGDIDTTCAIVGGIVGLSGKFGDFVRSFSPTVELLPEMRVVG